MKIIESSSLLKEKVNFGIPVFDFTYERMNFANHIQKWITEMKKSQNGIQNLISKLAEQAKIHLLYVI